MSGRIMICFDDGLACHKDAANFLSERDLRGVFGIVTSRVGSVGFLTEKDLEELRGKGHIIANHSEKHLWLGVGHPKSGLSISSLEQVTEDYMRARDFLIDRGYDGDYLVVPFGTSNIADPEHLLRLMRRFTWIRLTIGAPLPVQFGLWTIVGGKRLYPFNYRLPVIGISSAADTRHPMGVLESIDNAITTNSIAVILYHLVCDVVGDNMNVTWERFTSDIDYIDSKIRGGELENVTPNDFEFQNIFEGMETK